jgi:hypothetical protein
MRCLSIVALSLLQCAASVVCAADVDKKGSIPRLAAATDNYEIVLKIGNEEHAWVTSIRRVQSLAELACRNQEPVVGLVVRDNQNVVSISVPHAIKEADVAKTGAYTNVTVVGLIANEKRCDIVVEFEDGARTKVNVAAEHVQRMFEISYESKRPLMQIVVDEMGRVSMANLARPKPEPIRKQ